MYVESSCGNKIIDYYLQIFESFSVQFCPRHESRSQFGTCCLVRRLIQRCTNPSVMTESLVNILEGLLEWQKWLSWPQWAMTKFKQVFISYVSMCDSRIRQSVGNGGKISQDGARHLGGGGTRLDNLDRWGIPDRRLRSDDQDLISWELAQTFAVFWWFCYDGLSDGTNFRNETSLQIHLS